MGYLLNLETLLLGGNELTGSLPDLSKLTNLKILGLQDNHFTGNIPDDTWSMKKLEALYLDGNHLTGTVSVNIQNLRNLSDLRLRDNELSGGIEFLDGMSKYTNSLWMDFSCDFVNNSHLSRLQQVNYVCAIWITTNSKEIFLQTSHLLNI